MSILKKMAALIAVVTCTFAFTDPAYAGKPTGGPAKPPPASTAVHVGPLAGATSDGSTTPAVTGSVTLTVHQVVNLNQPIVLANIVLPTGFTWDGNDTVVVTGDDGNEVPDTSYSADFSGSSLTVSGISITNRDGDGDGTTDFTVSVPTAHITAGTAMTTEGTYPVSSQYRTWQSRKVKEQSWIVSTNGIITLDNGTSPTFLTGSANVTGVATDATTIETYTVDQPVTWSLTGTDASMFSISGGVLSFSGSPAPSATTTYHVTVVATDVLGNASTLDVSVATT